jgi:hypothetical protein
MTRSFTNLHYRARSAFRIVEQTTGREVEWSIAI